MRRNTSRISFRAPAAANISIGGTERVFCAGSKMKDSAVAAAEGASGNAKYQQGVLVFTIARGGLMYEASVGGQKFRFIPLTK